jgi:hypothetical protein
MQGDSNSLSADSEWGEWASARAIQGQDTLRRSFQLITLEVLPHLAIQMDRAFSPQEHCGYPAWRVAPG